MDAQVYFFNYCNQMDLNQSSMAACARVMNSLSIVTWRFADNNLTSLVFLMLFYFCASVYKKVVNAYGILVCE